MTTPLGPSSSVEVHRQLRSKNHAAVVVSVRALNVATQHSRLENESSGTKVSLELFKALVDVRGAPLPPQL